MSLSSLLRLSHQVENEYLAFLNELQKLEVLEYPTLACNDLISKLREQGLHNKDSIIKVREELLLVSPPIKEHLYRARIIFERQKLIEILTNFLDWIVGAQTQKVPWSFTPSIESLANKIIPDYPPILYCKNLYNYGIQWAQALPGNLDKYSFISLPRLHRSNILMHTLIGHELFHPCCESFTSKMENEVARRITLEVKKAFPDLDPDDLFGQKELGRMNAIVMCSWKRTLHELLCDMFCAELFGPAALLAMRSYVSFSDYKRMPDMNNNFYPPLQYRFEVICQNAMDKNALDTLWGEKSEIIQLFKSEIEELSKTFETNEGFEFVCTDNLNGIAYAEVNKLISEAHDYVISKLPDSIPRWIDEKALVQIPKLLERLQDGIPPNEIIKIKSIEEDDCDFTSEPAELPAILIAGWAYQIYREKNMETQDLLSYDTLSRLLLKACEDSEMLKCE
ncbi:MAG: hypothetical protein KAJ07_11125 [Planctomycetes bacterium]|nr:hypothetical protein [Planctomycetota bacterium]